jgi:hypothetical protein
MVDNNRILSKIFRISGFLDKIGTVGIHRSGWAATGLLAVSCSGPTVASKPDVAAALRPPNPGPPSMCRSRCRLADWRNGWPRGSTSIGPGIGRAPFARHGGLDRLAERHSEEMARSRKMSRHGFSERAQRQRAASGWCGPRSSRDEGSRFSDPNPGFQNVLF